MYCYNCGNVERFVLSIECSVVYRPPGFTDPDWRLMAQCLRCSSDDVAGDAGTLLARYRR